MDEILLVGIDVEEWGDMMAKAYRNTKSRGAAIESIIAETDVDEPWLAAMWEAIDRFCDMTKE